MGEIGIDRKQFLYELPLWEIKLIISGYRKRERTYLLMTRWATFMQMCTGMADIKKAGINSAEDLIKFSWEKEDDEDNKPSDDEVEEMRRMLQEENRKAGA